MALSAALKVIVSEAAAKYGGHPAPDNSLLRAFDAYRNGSIDRSDLAFKIDILLTILPDLCDTIDWLFSKKFDEGVEFYSRDDAPDLELDDRV